MVWLLYAIVCAATFGIDMVLWGSPRLVVIYIVLVVKFETDIQCREYLGGIWKKYRKQK